jgi:F1F0 ATPase subunit 2
MNEAFILLLAGLAGAALGVVFFGGLWWTVRRGVSARYPALWFFASGLLRTGITVVGFYLVGGAQWSRLVAALVGFIVARLAVLWLTRLAPVELKEPVPEARHAP